MIIDCDDASDFDLLVALARQLFAKAAGKP
jgi:hypothetical protein